MLSSRLLSHLLLLDGMIANHVALHPSSIPECGCSEALCSLSLKGRGPFSRVSYHSPCLYKRRSQRIGHAMGRVSYFLVPCCAANPCISHVGTIYFLYGERG